MWLYLWETYGYNKAHGLFLRDYIHDKGHVKPATAHMENVLGGKLDYLKMIIGEESHTYLSLRKRYDILMEDKITPKASTAQQEPSAEVEKKNLIESKEYSSIVELLELLIDKL